MKLKIEEPCTENWQKMSQNDIGRHCEKCNKSVVDFTSMSRPEIMIYLLENPNQRTCGRLKKNQFEFTEADLPVLLTTLSKPRFRNNAFLILALVCASLSSCTNEKSIQPPKQEIDKPVAKIEVVKKDTLSNFTDTTTQSSKEKSNNPTSVIPLAPIIFEPFPDPDPYPYVLGGIEPPEPPPEIISETKDSILDFAEVMPTFPGGMNAFMEFLQANLIYPEICKEIGIEGKVYVRFIVHTDGNCSRFEVLKTPHPELGKEAIRVLQQMPKWNPGLQNGQKASVKMNVPVSFKLD